VILIGIVDSHASILHPGLREAGRAGERHAHMQNETLHQSES